MNTKLMLITCFLSAGCASLTHAQFINEHMVVANRDAASISVIDVATNQVTSFDMPMAPNVPTPGYVVYSPLDDVVYVGDSANARVVAFDARTYQVVDPGISVGAGAFHMWGNAAYNQLWVTNPGAQTVSVIDMTTRSTLSTIDAPKVSGMATTPHDVILDPMDGSAYVTYFADGADLVVKYSPDSFMEVNRATVAEDPHLTLTDENEALYVATQDGGQVEIMSRATMLDLAPPISIANAHGATVMTDGSTLFVSSFPGAGGKNGIHAIDTLTNSLVHSVDAPAAGNGPHNLALSSDNTRLYATHTGASSLVSIYDVSGHHRQNPVFLQTIKTDQNPFGLAAVPAVPEPSGVVLIGIGIWALGSRIRYRSSPERFDR